MPGYFPRPHSTAIFQLINGLTIRYIVIVRVMSLFDREVLRLINVLRFCSLDYKVYNVYSTTCGILLSPSCIA